jgi:hypothetical protein
MASQDAKKRPRGRPSFEPTDEQRKMVTVMIGSFVPHETIARNIGPNGIDVDTLKKHFALEIETGRDQTLASLKVLVFKAAQKGSVRAQTWLLEKLGGPEFAPRLRLGLGGDADAPAIRVNSESKVVVYLPDNGRGDHVKPDGDDEGKA